MSIWGVTGEGKSCQVDEKRLNPLGLTCWGGSSSNSGAMTWHVYNADKSFDVYLEKEDFDNVDRIYNQFLRKYKLEKICKS
jgi:hypothetical protein